MRQTITALVILACTVSLRATTFIATDLNELTRDAQTIARGRVIAVESRWSDDHQRIETLVTLAAENYLKAPSATQWSPMLSAIFKMAFARAASSAP